MAYQLKPGEKLPRAIRRIAKGRVQRILCDLTHPAANRKEECVHQARKNLKKVRAALRLVRDELGNRVYRRDARHFRKVARALSQQRDAQVQLQTAEDLLGQYHGKLLREALMKLHRVLQQRLREVSHQPNGDIKKLECELEAACRHAKKWPVDNLKWDDLACGIGQTYKRASKGFQQAERTRKPEDLHEWRKRVKDLWYQLCILKPVQEKAIATLAQNMKRLGQLLGNDHDLFMIGEASKTAELNCRELEAIENLARERRKCLQKEAFQLGRRLFSEKPSEFIRRMERYGEASGN
jgi:CHAD domain-containing protein